MRSTIKLGLLRRLLDQAMLLRRKSVAADLRDGSGAEKLDHVLGEIDLRVAVELAQARGGLTPVPARGPPGVSDIPRAPLFLPARRSLQGRGIIVIVTSHTLVYRPARGEDLAQFRARSSREMQSVKSKNGRSDDSLHKNGKSIRPFEKLYRPSDREPFMNERQREYFRMKLLDWREDILKEAKETLQHLQDDNQNHPDLADRASSETDRAIELRARDRQRKLIAKIDAALARIEDGTYGYCEETGEPISLKRLEARPIATLSVEAQERHERRERVYREE